MGETESRKQRVCHGFILLHFLSLEVGAGEGRFIKVWELPLHTWTQNSQAVFSKLSKELSKVGCEQVFR